MTADLHRRMAFNIARVQAEDIKVVRPRPPVPRMSGEVRRQVVKPRKQRDPLGWFALAGMALTSAIALGLYALKWMGEGRGVLAGVGEAGVIFLVALALGCAAAGFCRD